LESGSENIGQTKELPHGTQRPSRAYP